MATPPPYTNDAFAAIYRTEVGRCTATLVRVLGDVDLAEDSVADAFAIAARKWPDDGIPPNPGGWITTTARNRAIDHLRRESTRDQRHRAAADLFDPEPDMSGDLGDIEVVPDDQLRLMFLCCHPALAPEVQVAMTLRLLGGLETREIASAFLVPEATMAQRLVRAKRKIRQTNMTYRIPTADQLPGRLEPVLAAIYLIFNEGHTGTSGSDLTRPPLSREAIRLGRVLADLLPGQPEAAGLLALMMLTEARRPARTGPDGHLVRLADQDRSMWDRQLIDEGMALVRRCLVIDEPGRYQLQAAIAAVHAHAATAELTDWSQIVQLYDHLLQFQDNDIVRLNRAIAVAESVGPSAGVEALDALELDRYHLYHATRGELLARIGDGSGARESFARAADLTDNDTVRRHYAARIDQLGA